MFGYVTFNVKYYILSPKFYKKWGDSKTSEDLSPSKERPIFLKMHHFMSSLITWDVVILTFKSGYAIMHNSG